MGLLCTFRTDHLISTSVWLSERTFPFKAVWQKQLISSTQTQPPFPTATLRAKPWVSAAKLVCFSHQQTRLVKDSCLARNVRITARTETSEPHHWSTVKTKEQMLPCGKIHLGHWHIPDWSSIRFTLLQTVITSLGYWQLYGCSSVKDRQCKMNRWEFVNVNGEERRKKIEKWIGAVKTVHRHHFRFQAIWLSSNYRFFAPIMAVLGFCHYSHPPWPQVHPAPAFQHSQTCRWRRRGGSHLHTQSQWWPPRTKKSSKLSLSQDIAWNTFNSLWTMGPGS